MPTDTSTTARRGSPGAAEAVPVPALPRSGCVEERDLVFAGFRYQCRIVGQSAATTAPVVLLGGSSQDRYSWTRHEKLLAPLCPVITVDLPGYGTAEFLPARYGIDFLAAAVQHMVAQLGVDRINLVGACYGAAIGIRYAQHYPDRLARLVLVGMTRQIPDHYAESVPRWADLLDRGEHETLASDLVGRFMSPPGSGRVRRHAAVARLLHRQFLHQTTDQMRMAVEHNERLMAHEWFRPEPLPSVPSLVFTGEHDTLTTPEMNRQVAAVLPAARFTTIKEADHLSAVERMAEFTDLIARFCTDRPIDELPYCNPVESLGDSPGPAAPEAPVASDAPNPPAQAVTPAH